jgi:hypothetical protein
MAGVRRYSATEIKPGGPVPGVLAITTDECRLLDLRELLAERAAARRPGL